MNSVASTAQELDRATTIRLFPRSASRTATMSAAVPLSRLAVLDRRAGKVMAVRQA